jgi:hypothetical protein
MIITFSYLNRFRFLLSNVNHKLLTFIDIICYLLRMKNPFRTIFIDPDYRRSPKTSVFCCVCQKDIKGAPKFYARVVDGCNFVHPEDEALVPAGYAEDYGTLPVGSDCAKRIGLEWVKKAT